MECLNETSAKFEKSDEYEVAYERPFTTETVGEDTEDNLANRERRGCGR